MKNFPWINFKQHVKLMRVPVALCIAVMMHNSMADEAPLQQRVSDLEKRVTELEQMLADTQAKDRWKDPLLWSPIKREMNAADVRKLLGKPGRIEEQIFTTWYYHPTSKLHSYIWFDEGIVLGWELPQ